jgi:hypothetical protein
MSNTVMIKVPTTARMLECCAGIAADGHQPKPAKPGSVAAEYLGTEDASSEQPAPEPPKTKKLGELIRRAENDPTELLRRGYLCRGGGLLIVGPSGIGKSSFATQAQILWVNGRALFGIQPARPLRSLVIQAENDEGDLAEMRDGVMAGLRLSPDEIQTANEGIITCTEDSRTSVAFCNNTLAPLLELHRPDLVWIDPALAYLGGDSNSQKDVGIFLRNLVNPLLHKFNCGGVICHHTNKPARGEEKPTWQAGDFAYLGAGSAEWANWARGVLAIRSIGSHKVFELRAGKRGGRIGWKNALGETDYFKFIGHATEPSVICWGEIDPAELPPAPTKRAGTCEDLLALVPLEKPVMKALLLDQWKDRHGNHVKGRAFLDELLESGKLHEWHVKRRGTNPSKLIARHPQPEPSL